jgi:hypothetical protein
MVVPCMDTDMDSTSNEIFFVIFPSVKVEKAREGTIMGKLLELGDVEMVGKIVMALEGPQGRVIGKILELGDVRM